MGRFQRRSRLETFSNLKCALRGSPPGESATETVGAPNWVGSVLANYLLSWHGLGAQTTLLPGRERSRVGPPPPVRVTSAPSALGTGLRRHNLPGVPFRDGHPGLRPAPGGLGCGWLPHSSSTQHSVAFAPGQLRPARDDARSGHLPRPEFGARGTGGNPQTHWQAPPERLW